MEPRRTATSGPNPHDRPTIPAVWAGPSFRPAACRRAGWSISIEVDYDSPGNPMSAANRSASNWTPPTTATHGARFSTCARPYGSRASAAHPLIVRGIRLVRILYNAPTGVTDGFWEVFEIEVEPVLQARTHDKHPSLGGKM